MICYSFKADEMSVPQWDLYR